jgi:hypothetical protein
MEPIALFVTCIHLKLDIIYFLNVSTQKMLGENKYLLGLFTPNIN